MNLKIVKFKNSPIQCNFENAKIDCYQEGACSNISSNNYRQCTEKEINEVLGIEQIEIPDNQSNTNNTTNTNSENENENNNDNVNDNNGILIGSIIGICVIIILTMIIILKKINKKNKLEIDNDNDIEIYERKIVNMNEESNKSTVINNQKKNIDDEKQFITQNNIQNDEIDYKFKKINEINDNNIIKINMNNNNDFNSYDSKKRKIKLDAMNTNINPPFSEEFPIIDNSNFVGESSNLPSYDQLEQFHAVQPFNSVNVESKLLLGTKKRH